MTLKDKIISLYQEGLSSNEIRKETGNNTGYVYKVLGDLGRSKKIDDSSPYTQIETKRCEMIRKEKLMDAILPYKKPEDKILFHNLEKDLVKLKGDISYLKKQIVKSLM